MSLRVDPEPSRPADQFSSLPVDSVWQFDRNFSTIEFTETPETLIPEAPHWLVWNPTNEPTLNSLAALSGGGSYLIKATNNATWNIVGRPVLQRTVWYPSYANFVGFPVNPASEPSFMDFFSACAEIDASRGPDSQIYEVMADGSKRQVRDTLREKLRFGAAYWIKPERSVVFTAPVEVTAPTTDGLVFGDNLQQLTLRLWNRGSANVTITVREMDSVIPPSGFPENAGPVPLTHLITEPGSNQWTWVSSSTNLVVTNELAAGETWSLMLAVSRSQLIDKAPVGTNGIAYQSLLEVTDSHGMVRYQVPVSAEYSATAETNMFAYNPLAGLWVGEAWIQQVSRPVVNTNLTLQSNDMEPTSQAFPLRLIMHVGREGSNQVTRLLQRVIVGEMPPVSSNDPPRVVLWTDEDNVPAEASGLKRISSIGFPPDPMVFAGSFGDTLAGTNVLAFDHPVNPFVHGYHPDHDNKDPDGNPLAEGVESFTVTRGIALSFSNNLEEVTNPLLGVEEVFGGYRETVTGLNKEQLKTRGVFYLKRLLRNDQLDF